MDVLLMSEMPRVAILMATYNGEKYIRDQLRSLDSQFGVYVKIFVGDDGSTDGTLSILHEYSNESPTDIEIIRGHGLGFAQNFLALLALPDDSFEYFAFCDQDDVWSPVKLVSGIARISGRNTPALYCGRTQYVDEALSPSGMSPLFHEISFNNALVQSLAGGNTMIWNREFNALVREIKGVRPQSHDWWFYQVATGVGAYIFYDQDSYILYRQHAGAQVGGNQGLIQRLRRVLMLFEGNFRQQNDRNIHALNHIAELFTSDAKVLIKKFSEGRDGGFRERCMLYFDGVVKRQSVFGDIALVMGLAAKRI